MRPLSMSLQRHPDPLVATTRDARRQICGRQLEPPFLLHLWRAVGANFAFLRAEALVNLLPRKRMLLDVRTIAY